MEITIMRTQSVTTKIVNHDDFYIERITIKSQDYDKKITTTVIDCFHNIREND